MSMIRIAAAAILLALISGWATGWPASAAPATRTVAVFDFELIDTSLEGASRGVDAAETARLTRISGLLRDLLATSGKYTVVNLAPAAAKIADAAPIHGCNGCEIAIAGALGAERVVTGTVQKVSTLILTLSIFESDVATGGKLQLATAQIRGNTDESWARGVEWLVHNQMLAAH